MALAGLLYFETMGVGARESGSALANMLSIAAPLLLALHAAAWAQHMLPDHQLTADSLALAMGSDVGRVEAWRVGLAVLAPWALLLARRPRLALLFATLSLAASGASGHSAAIQPMWAIPARSLHLLAGALWIGGVLHLVASLRDDAALIEREAQRVSGVALIAVLVVAASGVLQALLFLPSPSAVLGSSYGTLLLAKVAGLLLLAAFGARHRLRMVRDRRAPEEFSFSLRAELAVMAVVTALGAVLAYVSPPI
jgi:putative copper export protein